MFPRASSVPHNPDGIEVLRFRPQYSNDEGMNTAVSCRSINKALTPELSAIRTLAKNGLREIGPPLSASIYRSP